MISSNRSWRNIGGFRCDLQSGPWWYDGKEYLPIDPNQPFENFKGYWVKVGSDCTMFSASLKGLRPSSWADSLLPPGPPAEAQGLFASLLKLLGIAPSGVAASGQPLSLPAPLAVQAIRLQSRPSGMAELTVQGHGIAGTELQLFGLNGQLLADVRGTGSTLNFSLLDRSGQPLANGVYLYVVIVQGSDGRTLTSEVRKFAVLR